MEQRKRDGEYLNDNSPLFRTSYRVGSAKVKPMSLWAMKSVIPKLINKAGIIREKRGTRYNIQADHGLRKRFNTILKKNKDIPHAIVRHSDLSVPKCPKMTVY